MSRIKIAVPAVILLGFLGLCLFLACRLGPIAAGYKAKTLCTGVFVSQRSVEDVLAHELKVDSQPILHLAGTQIDHGAQTVTGTFAGFIERHALFRPGLGCTLAGPKGPAALRPQALTPSTNTAPDPFDRPAENFGVDMKKLQAVVDDAFAEPDPERLRRTRAVVVVHQGRIVAERYAPGIGPDTPLHGWSMTKSVMGTLTGALVRQGRLALHDPVDIWRQTDDPRSAITLDHLLRMTDGLAWRENYVSPFSEVLALSWGRDDMAAFAAERPLAHPPGSHWNYSSATTTILARALRAALDDDANAYFAFPRRALFEPLGMTTAVIEPDAAGTFGGATFMYATARDWARWGLLLLSDGVWNGKRILPEGWVAYLTRPTPQSTDHIYGAHFWLKVPPSYYNRDGERPALPKDAFFAVGHWGQIVTIIPSRDLVVVRLGLSMHSWSWDQERFLANLLQALPR